MQYTASVVLMISAFVINRQMHFIANKDLGFDKEQVLMVYNPTWLLILQKMPKERSGKFRKVQSYISQFSGMNGGLDGSYNTNGFLLNGEQKWKKRINC